MAGWEQPWPAFFQPLNFKIMSDSPTLKLITNHNPEAFTLEVETFLSKIKNPDTIKTQFDVKQIQNGTGVSWYTAFILFSGGLNE